MSYQKPVRKYRKTEMPQQFFTDVFAGVNYAVDTLINGNITECITYLKDLLECGNVGIAEVHDQLNRIKEHCPDRYNFVATATFAIPSGLALKRY